MNRNITALILIVLAIGIYFTFTSAKIDELKAIRAVNAEYQEAIDNSAKLIDMRDKVLADYQKISPEDKDRLNKIIPDNVDNVRLIIDVKDDIAARHGLALKGIKTSSPEIQNQTGVVSSQAPVSNTGPGAGLIGNGNMASAATQLSTPNKYGIVTLSFTVTTTYQNFVEFLKDMEASLRIMDISKLTIATPAAAVKGTAPTGTYDFAVEIRTYWLK